MHDPFQTYATLGQHYGIPSQIGLQYPSLQALAMNPLSQAGGIPQMGQSPFGINAGQGQLYPQQLQIASLLASQAGLQNPLLASVLSNPLIAASLYAQALGAHAGPQFGAQQQHSLYPQMGQMGSAFGQIPQFGQGGSPFGQGGSPFGQMSPFGQGGLPFGQGGYPLAPQSWIGQGQGGQWGGQGFAHVHPLHGQMGQRPFLGQGFSPWGY